MLPEISISNNTINVYTNKTNDITPQKTTRYLPIDKTESQLYPVATEIVAFSIQDDKYKHFNNLIQQYIKNDTQNFTDDDWLTLIIKLGRRQFTPAKLVKYKPTYSKVGMEVFLTKIAELQPLRHELENAIAKINCNYKIKLYYYLQRKNELFKII